MRTSFSLLLLQPGLAGADGPENIRRAATATRQRTPLTTATCVVTLCPSSDRRWVELTGGRSQINSAAKVGADGNYLVSMRGPSTIYYISASTGEIIWRLGGKNSNFTMGTNATCESCLPLPAFTVATPSHRSSACSLVPA